MTNLFRNPAFADLADWKFTFANQERADSPIPGENMPLPGQDQPFHQPRISAVEGLVEISLENNPIWAGLAQLFTAQVGANYKLSAKVWPDLSHNGVKAGPESCEFRFISQGPSQWISPAIGITTPVTTSFTPIQSNLNVGFEVRTRHGLSRIRWLVSEPVLELVSAAPNADVADKYENLEQRLIAISTVVSLAGTDIEQIALAIQNAQVELARLRQNGV